MEADTHLKGRTLNQEEFWYQSKEDSKCKSEWRCEGFKLFTKDAGSLLTVG